MKSLLKYLPAWKNVKIFLDVFYYVGFVCWFLMNAYNMIFYNHKVTNEDLFISLMFIFFGILDKIEITKEK